MKLVRISIVTMSLLGFGLLSGLGVPAADADFVFGPSSSIAAGAGCSSPSVTADGLLLFVDSEMSGGRGGYDIWVLARVTANDDWGPPTNLGTAINGSYNECNPFISADGLTLFFDSDRPGGSGNRDLWVTTRATRDGLWSPPVNLGPSINSGSYDGHACLSADELSLYFTSDRPAGYGDRDTWVTTRETIDGVWSAPRNLGPVVNSSAWDAGPCISPDGQILFFGSTRSSTYSDLWYTRRTPTGDAWMAPVNLGPAVNNLSGSITPGISADGCTLYFHTGQFISLRQVPIIPVVDFNTDGKVDVNDLTLLVDNWGTDKALYDIGPMPWGDGKVDIEDLKVFVAEWAKWEKQEKWTPPPQTGLVFGPVTNLGPVINTAGDDFTGAISPDMLEFYIGDRSSTKVFRRATVDSAWTPSSIFGLDAPACFSADGLSLYGTLANPVDLCVWTRTRTAGRWGLWGPAVNLGANVNSSSWDWSASLSSDGLELYFTSNRPGGCGDMDMYVAKRATKDAPWSPAVNLGPTLNSPAWDESPTIAPDGLTLFFCSMRAGGYGSADIYVARRTTTQDPWGLPVNLGPTVNSPQAEANTVLAPDGTILYFVSDRPGGYGAGDVWQVTIAPSSNSTSTAK